MEKLFVALDDSEDAIRSLVFGQRLAAQLEVDVSAISVVPEQDNIAARRSRLQSLITAHHLGAIALDVVAHESAKVYLGELASRDNAGLCMMAHGPPVSG